MKKKKQNIISYKLIYYATNFFLTCLTKESSLRLNYLRFKINIIFYI